MEIKDISRIEEALAEEFEVMNASPDREIIAKEKFIPVLKQELALILMKTSQNLYYLIKDHPITVAHCRNYSDLKDPESLAEILKNMKIMQSVSNKLSKSIKLYEKENPKREQLFDYKASRDEFARFLNAVINYTSSAVYLTSDEVSKKTRSAYMKILSKTLPIMRNSLETASDYVGDWGRQDNGYIDIFNQCLEFFTECSDSICLALRDIQALENLKAQEEKERLEQMKPKTEPKPLRKVEPVGNPDEEERKAWIKKANDLYDELCMDFMRDLEKQYSQSTKDMYENFVNVKFKKFVERFNMPLSNSVSVGQAKEAYSQIRNLMDYVSKISENAYTISVYSK